MNRDFKYRVLDLLGEAIQYIKNAESYIFYLMSDFQSEDFTDEESREIQNVYALIKEIEERLRNLDRIVNSKKED
ncbi:MAG TPA: hypothetical protein PKV21_08865 [bacterium]|nr:hypothetical protein [bacterium]